MHSEVRTFLAFKGNTLLRVVNNEITMEMANTIIQPALTEAITKSSMGKPKFLKEVAGASHADYGLEIRDGKIKKIA